MVMTAVAPAAGAGAAAVEVHGREKTRLTKSAAGTIGQGKIGGEFSVDTNPAFLAHRIAVFDRIMAVQEAAIAAKPRSPIIITLPDGRTVDGVAWETTPLAIATSISKGLAGNAVVAKVKFSGPVDRDNLVNTGPDEEGEGPAQGELWDLTRPLPQSCSMQLLTFEDKEGKMVFWHSSAHVLGEGLECAYGCHLCVGPPIQDGFYYDAFMGAHSVPEADLKSLSKRCQDITKAKQPFQRIVLTKAEALEMFQHNPFKTQIISTKIPDGKCTTAYRCGPLIDLCTGPHVPDTGRIKAITVLRASASYWLGKQDNDTLQRVYGISFPDKNLLKEWIHNQEEAEKRDHRLLGTQQELFFFHPMSPGSCFFLPHGARIYTKLMDFIKAEYWTRGYSEVVTPNLFKFDLWHISGHALHYRDAMFIFDQEGEGEYGLKPMNCPGHCLMFDHRIRSYRELPLRLADFGVLHRNELSGALTGLTRVRRFCQDDAHIFCREDQIKQEVLGALDFMRKVYGIFGMTFALELSTRPAKALGRQELWDSAEAALSEALNEFAGEGGWRENPGDGAFYGPKIDIKVQDALKRVHQCATVQLDFQLPIRFNLKYRYGGEAHEEGEGEEGKESSDAGAAAAPAAAGAAAGAGSEDCCGGSADAAAVAAAAADDVGEGFRRPIIVHRAMLGSVERMIAVLTEHFGGKWPFWLSPRQAIVVPLAKAFNEYGRSIQQALHAAGFYADIDESHKTFNKKVREAQLAQYNYILVVGEQEASSGTMSVRTRDNKVHDTKYSVAQIIEIFNAHERDHN